LPGVSGLNPDSRAGPRGATRLNRNSSWAANLDEAIMMGREGTIIAVELARAGFADDLILGSAPRPVDGCLDNLRRTP